MAVLQQIIPLVIAFSLAGLVAAVGLDATISELLTLVRQPRRLAKAVVAVNVVVPVAAAILVQLFPLDPAVRGGIMLMAVSPVPPLVSGKQLKAGASKAYAYSLDVTLALLAVIVVPATVAIFEHIYDVDIPLGPLAVLRNVAVGVVAPLALGLAVRRLAPRFAERATGPLRATSMILLLVAALPLIVAAWPAVAGLAGDGAFLAMALVVLAGIAAGHLLGGPPNPDRAALAMAASTRHPGIAILIAKAGGADKAVAAAILAFLLVGLVAVLPYQMWLKRRTPVAVPA